MDSSQIRHRVEQEVFPHRPSALVRGFATKNYNIQMHDHSFYEINVVIEGRGKHFLEAECFEAKPGDVFVIPPSVPHGYESCDSGFNVYHLILKDAFFARYGEEIRLLHGYNHLFTIEPYLRKKAKKLFLNLDFKELADFSQQVEIFEGLPDGDSLQADVFRNIRALSIIASLCHSMMLHMQQPDSSVQADYAAISESLAYIHNSLAEKLRIDQLAAMSAMSRATYIRKFRALFGKAPMEYILSCRIKSARERIAYGQKKSQVAQECGFYDVCHMEKALKKDQDRTKKVLSQNE